MVLRVGPTSSGRRHGLISGPRIQQDFVQHETGHCNERGPDHILQRYQTSVVPRHCSVPHHPEHEGLGGPGGGFRVPPPEPGRQVHRGGHVHRRPSAAAELAGCGDPGAS